VKGSAAPGEPRQVRDKSAAIGGGNYYEVWNELAPNTPDSIMRSAGQADTVQKSDSTEPIVSAISSGVRGEGKRQLRRRSTSIWAVDGSASPVRVS
jgi:hypothetical protein